MTLAGIYPWMKAFHVASALVFVGGVLSVAGFLQLCRHGPAHAAAMATTVRLWDHRLTTPAMLLVWAFGLELALSGAWFESGWLRAKLVLVVVLSGIHGVQSGTLRRLAQGVGVEPSRREWLLGACVLGIPVLAVVKPF